MVLFAYEELSYLLENALEKPMSTMSKYDGGCSKKVNTDGGKDRISGLPNEILTQILSLLPSKYAFAMRILSSKWKDLWSSVPVLDFDDDELGCLRLCDCICARPFNFIKFVNVVVTLHKLPSISKFRLKCVVEDNTDSFVNEFEQSMEKLIKRVVQEIDVCIFVECHVKLPYLFFYNKTLVVLRLGYKLRIHIPSNVKFPSLKILKLSLLHPDLSLLGGLFFDCSVLEYLDLEVFLGVSKEMNLFIFNPTLKRLEISIREDDVQYCDYKILIDHTPNLEHLSIHDDLLVCNLRGDLPSLAKAIISVGPDCFQDENIHHANRAHNIIKGLSHVKSLSLSYSVIEVFNLADDCNLPMFYNLTHFEIYPRICYGWKWLLNLLKSMPNLEILDLHTISVHDEDDDGSDDDWKSISTPSEVVPSCLLSRLKEIKFHGFEGRNDDINFMKYLLKNAKVLQKVTIGCGCNISVTEKMKLQEELLSCPKDSKTCQIECS